VESSFEHEKIFDNDSSRPMFFMEDVFMKRPLILHSAILGICLAMTSVGVAQTTTTRGTPTISGFSPNPVSGFTSRPMSGLNPAPVQGLSPTPVFPRTTNFTTGSISPLSTTIGGLGNTPIVPAPVVPAVPVPPVPTTVTNAVGTPLF
jgi:hypothetical protein